MKRFDKNNDSKEPFKDDSDFKCSSPVSGQNKTTVVEHKSKDSNKVHFKCDKCDYNCKKEVTLKRHIDTKHEVQQCKVCSKKLVSTIELLQHIAQEHSINKDTTELQDPKEVMMTKKKEDDKEKDKSFVFSESMFFDEFL